MRETARLLRSAALDIPAAGTDCLDEMAIANVIDARAAGTDVMAHLASCAYCRGRVAGAARLLGTAAVANEVGRLERNVPHSASGRRYFAPVGMVAGLAAAALAGLLLWPAGTRTPLQQPAGNESTVNREATIATTIAPRAVAPLGAVAKADTLCWTTVPGADRYRVTMFDRAGVVVWDAQASDTMLALPRTLRLAQGALYLWKVEARTGWDRWVASGTAEFTVRPER
ncbi:MAG: hypothetical protein ACRENP_26590 [Longimicrobiales bacterium]